MLDKFDVITLNNDCEYIVVNTTELDDINYLFLVAKDGVSDFKICSYDESISKIKVVTDEIIFNKLIKIFK